MFAQEGRFIRAVYMQKHSRLVNSGCQGCGHFLVDLYFSQSAKKMHCCCGKKTGIFYNDG